MTGRLPRTKGPFQPELETTGKRPASHPRRLGAHQPGEHVLGTPDHETSIKRDAPGTGARQNVAPSTADPPKAHYAHSAEILNAHGEARPP